jgi:hypothetical protein
LRCQPELVEGGFHLLHRVRQAHPDNILKLELFNSQPPSGLKSR